MKKAWFMMLTFVLMVVLAGAMLAKEPDSHPVPFKDAVRANEVEPNDECGQATPLTVDDPMAASISPVGDVDWFEFTASAGQCVVFETSPGEGQVGGDTQMYLYADDCTTQLEYDDDGGGGLYSLFDHTFAAAGTYFIRINEYGNNGVIDAYVLTAVLCPPPPEENGSRCAFLTVCHDWDFSVSDQGFTHELCDPAGVAVWEWGTTSFVSGAPGTVWGTVLEANYPTFSGEALVSPPFDVIPGVCDWMEIRHFVQTEWFSPTSTIYDGCNVTVNDIIIPPVEGYDGVAGTAPRCVASEEVFAGNSANGPSRTWGRSCFDLSQFAGQTIQVHFDFGSDGSVQYPGWYLAYVKVGTTEVPIPIEGRTWGNVKSLYK